MLMDLAFLEREVTHKTRFLSSSDLEASDTSPKDEGFLDDSKSKD
jgi:hypothetical protein